LTGLIDLLNLKLPILQFSPLNYYFNNKKIFYELIYILSATEHGLEKIFKSLLCKKIVVIAIN
jgi:hypothetical protein